MMMSLIQNKKILICSGSGGVGKTTVSAAIALEAAKRGKKVVVLTIDPAKRLATAMGLKSLDSIPRQVPGVSGKLFAMMLDTKRTFDRLIERYTSDPSRRKSIFENRLYQHMSSMIAGSQEYMAMEKLYELYQEGGYDLLVLDTPPTRHALDFLEAPGKMANLTGNSLLHWFLKPGLFAGRIGAGMFQKGAEKILSVFDRLAGFSFLYELSEMISLLSDLLGGFHDRSRAVSQLLKKDFVGFLLVTTPSSVAIQDALYFHQKIKESKLPFLGFIVNRVHEFYKKDVSSGRLVSSLPPPLRAKVLSELENYERLSLQDQGVVDLLKKMGGKKIFSIPFFMTDVHDLGGLERMNNSLFKS